VALDLVTVKAKHYQPLTLKREELIFNNI